VEGFGRQHDLVPLALERHAQRRLGAPLLIDIGGVDEVDAQVERTGDDRVDAGLIHLAAKLVGAQPDHRYLYPRTPQ
jgi:hypothetical protein